MKILVGLALVAGLLSGCQGPEKEPEKPVSMGTIPEDYRALWKSWLLGEPGYYTLRKEALQDPHKTAFLVENLVGVMLGELTAGRIEPGLDIAPSTYRRSRLELVDLGSHSAAALAEVLPLGMGLGPVAVGDLLVEIGVPAIEPLLVQLVRDDVDLARRRAAKALASLAKDGIPEQAPAKRVREALGERLAGDADWIVRGQSALALAPWGRRTASEMAHSSRFLVPALKDADESVRTDVVHGLARLGDPRTFPALINFLQQCERKGDVTHAMLTQAALAAMTRERGAKTPSDWRDWWRDARPGVLDRFLKKYDYAPPEPGPEPSGI